MADSTSAERAPEPTATPSKTVKLQFLSPSPELNGLSLEDVDIDIDIGSLRDRISHAIPNGLAPERQRLIYQGHAWTDPKVKLRTYLQRELDSSPPDIFKIHLVTTEPHSQATTAGPNTPRGLPVPPTSASQSRIPIPGQQNAAHAPPHVHFQQHIRPGNPTHLPQVPLPAAFQQNAHHNQHNNFQQLQALQQQLQNNMLNPGAQFTQPFLGGMPQGMPGLPPTQQGLPNFQTLIGQAQQQRAMAGMHGMPGLPGMPFPGGLPNGPLADNADQQNRAGNGQTAPNRQTSIQETVGPDGQRMRVTTTTSVETVILSRSGTPQLPSRGTQAPNPSEQTRPESQPPASSRPPSAISNRSAGGNLNHPISPMPSVASYGPILPPLGQFRSMQYPSPSVPTTAWLLSGPTGPQAILYSPEHGTFSTQPLPTPTQATPSSHPTGVSLQARNPRGRAAQPLNQNAPVVRRRRGENQRNQPDQDILALAVSRIWLFVRLYLFVLMFTEPGSWLRYAILTGAVLYCCSPPNNFFQDQFARIQGHLEGLVPLAPPANARPAQNQNNANQPGVAGGGGDANETQGRRGRRGRDPDPHEAAQRLLQQHNEQNSPWWYQTARRIERSVALFLASLIPGVGERHIRARNEAEAARQAAERETQEGEAGPNEGENSVDAPAAPATDGQPNNGQGEAEPDQGARPDVQAEARQEQPPLVEV